MIIYAPKVYSFLGAPSHTHAQFRGIYLNMNSLKHVTGLTKGSLLMQVGGVSYTSNIVSNPKNVLAIVSTLSFTYSNNTS